jgi:hypothetical protein
MRSPTVEWQVCGVCNYDCSYCIQSREYRQGHPCPAEVDAFLRFFPTLPGRWEVKMTGGEPFAFKGFMERIVPGLVATTAHTISVLTNLSAPLGVLERFASLTRGRLGIVSASLHLEHTGIEDFVAKAKAFAAMIDHKIVINSVLVPGKLADGQAVREALRFAGLKYFPQIMKIGPGVATYDGEEEDLVELTGRAPTPRDANLAPSYRGRMCWSGVEYFVLTQRGEGWACRTARRRKEGFLGNVLDGTFRLAGDPAPCSYDICPCTVPFNRGMIA